MELNIRNDTVITNKTATTNAAFFNFLVFIKTFFRLFPVIMLEVDRRISARIAKNKLRSKKFKGNIIILQLYSINIFEKIISGCRININS